MSEGFPRRARRWRYLGYAAGALVALALLLVLGSWLAVRIWGPEFARERLEIALSSALERPTRVERVSVQPWLGRVVIGDVTAAARPGEPGPHFFKLARLEINLGLSSLWRRRLVLRSIRLERDWARRLVEQDIVRAKFLDARFAAFVFPDDDAITRELGPGEHDEGARERLVRQAASEAQATWLAEARRRASIKILLPAGSSVPPRSRYRDRIGR